jgi:phosphoribosylformylglycinamidine (FGAM) synthase PurS component
MKVQLLVGLLIPDTTAITSFHAIERMGYKIKSLARQDYYSFEVDSDSENFAGKIIKVDILVNANKHKAIVYKGSEKITKAPGEFLVLVKSFDGSSGLLSTLRDRLGFSNIKSMEHGTLWRLNVADEKTAKEITDKLLHNKHYQTYALL